MLLTITISAPCRCEGIPDLIHCEQPGSVGRFQCFHGTKKLNFNLPCHLTKILSSSHPLAHMVSHMAIWPQKGPQTDADSESFRKENGHENHKHGPTCDRPRSCESLLVSAEPQCHSLKKNRLPLQQKKQKIQEKCWRFFVAMK